MIYLYVKVHNRTGLKYFGKTTRRDVHKYKGSGLKWKRHIAKYGYDVTTTIVGEFDTEDEAREFAIAFSREFNIVDSDEWANLIEENGCDGAPCGHAGYLFSQEQRDLFSEKSTLRWRCPDYREMVIHAQRMSWDEQRRDQQAAVTKEMWTENRRKSHSVLLKEMYAENPHMRENISSWAKAMTRTQEHKQRISNSLTGKSKSSEHRESLAWSRLKGSGVHSLFDDYSQFASYCLSLHLDGHSKNSIAAKLGVSYTAIDTAIKSRRLNGTEIV